MIKAEHLSFGYGRNKQVFNDFNLEIEEGKIVGLLGKNGTGKSTLLYIICGLLKPSHGNVTIKGIDIKRRLPQTLSDIYLIPEEFDLPNLSMKQFVKLNSGFYPNFSNETLNTCLTDFDLGMDINLGELSMGQKKKAYMCFALATNTSLLLMDEPTNGLDIPSKSQFRKVIASGMTDEKTIIISTHQVRDIDRLLDHITIIDGNAVQMNNSIKDITDRLYFAEQGMNEPVERALFVQPSVYGNSVIMENKFGEESPVNLEVLFNAILAEREKIQSVFNK
ncbi:MAG: ATP-binding cassette domain-containing protein [Phocaeicola sp.]